MPDSPGDDFLAAARVDLTRIASTTTRIGTVLGAVAILALVLIVAGLTAVAITVFFSCATVGSIFGTAALRARRAKRGLRDGPYQRVHAVGWCRPPDGCNYALFALPGSQPEPDWVLRLPLRRPMIESDGWLCGTTEPSLLGGVALVSDESQLLAHGRIVPREKGLRRWRRRATAPSRLVMKPPENWYPPGGE